MTGRLSTPLHLGEKKKKVEKLREQNLFHEEVECVADFVDYGEREHWSAVRSGIKEIEEI